MKLTAKQRDALPDAIFAFPRLRKLPLDEKARTESAWHLLPRTKDMTEEEVVEARKRILAKAKHYGIDTSKWKVKGFSAESIGIESFREDLTPRQQMFRRLILGAQAFAVSSVAA
jgi:hypothetical protein